jgi:hypothetical protein
MENFQQYLMDKYPDLFYKNEEGKPVCHCGVWVPEGWYTIVDELCGCIQAYIKGTSRSERKVLSKWYYFWNTLRVSVKEFHLFLILKLFKRLNTSKFNAPWIKLENKINRKAVRHVKYVYTYPPEVKIGQIKEKFGGLRFYIDGGDKEVQGMISFAEYLCSKTCEVSGNKGELCVRGSWFKTLAPEMTENGVYKGYIPIKNESINN